MIGKYHMKVITNLAALDQISGGWLSSLNYVQPEDGGADFGGGGGGGGSSNDSGPIQTVVIDGTNAKAALARNDALASFSCTVIGTGVALAAGILTSGSGPLAVAIGGGIASATKSGCNMLVNNLITNDRRKNNQVIP